MAKEMKPFNQGSVRHLTAVGLLLGAVLAATLSCSDDVSSGTDSNTHWLQQCGNDADCGELSCLCGVCTRRCDEASACTGLGTTTQCSAMSSCNGVEPAGSVCTAECAGRSDCTKLGAGLVCVDGHCESEAGEEGSEGGSAGEANTTSAGGPGSGGTGGRSSANGGSASGGSSSTVGGGRSDAGGSAGEGSGGTAGASGSSAGEGSGATAGASGGSAGEGSGGTAGASGGSAGEGSGGTAGASGSSAGEGSGGMAGASGSSAGASNGGSAGSGDNAGGTGGTGGTSVTTDRLVLDRASLEFYILPTDSVRFAVTGYDPDARTCATIVWMSAAPSNMSVFCDVFDAGASLQNPYVVLTTDTDGPCSENDWDYAGNTTTTNSTGCVEFTGWGGETDMIDVELGVEGTLFTGTIVADNRPEGMVTFGFEYTADLPEDIYVQSMGMMSVPEWLHVTKDGAPVTLFEDCGVPNCELERGVCGASIPIANNITAGGLQGSRYVDWDGRVWTYDEANDCVRSAPASAGTYELEVCYGASASAADGTPSGSVVDEPLTCRTREFTLPSEELVTVTVNNGG